MNQDNWEMVKSELIENIKKMMDDDSRKDKETLNIMLEMLQTARLKTNTGEKFY